jgi:copper(I)-binding protein
MIGLSGFPAIIAILKDKVARLVTIKTQSLRSCEGENRTGRRGSAVVQITEHNLKITLACSALLTMFATSLTMPAAVFAEDSPNVSIGTLFIEGAFTRPTKAGDKDAEGYLSIINEGSVPDRLVSVDSDIANKAELRASGSDGQTLSDGIEIPAGATVNLAPGGQRVTFLNIHHPLKDGDIIHATLGFENAGQIDIGFHAIPSLSSLMSSGDSKKK